MSNGDVTNGRQISRTATGPADPFNSLLQMAGIAAGQQAGFNVGGSNFGAGLGFNSDVFGGGGASSPIGGGVGGTAGVGGFRGGRFGRGPMGGGPLTNGPGSVPQTGTPQGGMFGGVDVLGPARQNLASTLSGDFLSPDSNPYLADTFNRAADLTRTRLSSEFAGAGRDIGASLPARSDELQTLASGIFGGNFQNERNRQMAGLDQARQLDPLNEFIRRLGVLTPMSGRNVVQESTADQEAKASPLDRAIGVISALGGIDGGGGATKNFGKGGF